ncbi:MAG: cell division protein CrgA [Nocardioidaceae bacterium]
MPESRPRKKPDYTPPAGKRGPAKGIATRWAAPAMVTCWLVGLAWIVIFYTAGTDIPGMKTLGNWNILIGMCLLGSGFIFATKWE